MADSKIPNTHGKHHLRFLVKTPTSSEVMVFAARPKRRTNVAQGTFHHCSMTLSPLPDNTVC